jgi:hypothetical protein
MTLVLIATRLRQMADRIDALPSASKNLDISDEFVPKFVTNAFVDLKQIESFGGVADRRERP